AAGGRQAEARLRDVPAPEAGGRRPGGRRPGCGQTVRCRARSGWARAADDRRTIRRILHPGSPAASLDRVLGPAGLCRVVGMPLGEEPEKFLAETDRDAVT